MKILTATLAGISGEPSLRYDYDYHEYKRETAGACYTFSDLFELNNPPLVDPDDLHVDFRYCEIGNAYKDGSVEPELLNFDNRDLLTENYYKKIEEGDIIAVSEGDILLSKVRPNLRKFVRITPDLADCYFTSAFISLHPRRLPVVLHYALRTLFYQNLIAVSRQGKGYPTLNVNDLRLMQFDKAIIDTLIAHEEALTREIIEIEERIRALKDKIKPAADIINEVFEQELRLDVAALTAIGQTKTAHTDYQHLTFNNSNLRFSSRWHKAEVIQEAILQMSDAFQPLGKYIIETQNGYSPECADTASELQVLSLDALEYNGILSLDKIKYSDTSRDDIAKFEVNNGDFLVSRGNGSDKLISLASIATIPEDQQRIIFPDIMIRVTFNEKINSLYMVYVFNSFIGRLYFPFSAKGSNMKKTSRKELNDFYVPILAPEDQQRIVDEIQVELARHDTTRNQIADLRHQIEVKITQAVTSV